MLRILEHIPKQLVPALRLPALGRVLEQPHSLRRKGLAGRWGQGAPGVELAVGPVCV